MVSRQAIYLYRILVWCTLSNRNHGLAPLIQRMLLNNGTLLYFSMPDLWSAYCLYSAM